jgi:hypothetical protein
MAQQLSHYQGRVIAANARGLKLEGAASYFNVSKFRPVELPPVGAHVDVAVEEGNWLHSVAVLDGQDAHSAPTRPTAPSTSRDAMIARHVALKAAVAYCAAREGATTEHILPLATPRSAWLTRARDGEEGGAGTPAA